MRTSKAAFLLLVLASGIFLLNAVGGAAEPANESAKKTDLAQNPTKQKPAKLKKAEKKSHQKMEPDDSLTSEARVTLTFALKNLKTVQAVVANNIANAETPGFKKSKVVLAENGYRQKMLPGKQDSTGNYTPVGVAVGDGSHVSAVKFDMRQGSLQCTGDELDVAVEGSGFLQVQNPADNATLYTRAGKLSKNANGNLVLCSADTGRLLEPPIQIPQDATTVVISPDGQVSVGQPGNSTLTNVGQIQLATFINPQGLLKIGENLYQETDGSGPPTQNNPGQNGIGTLRQGFLETSNVDLDEEIRELKRIGRSCRKIELLLDEQ
jgi:flagellar basal-body rod protein FlgG